MATKRTMFNELENEKWRMKTAYTLNPKYDKRYKMGEDNYLVLPNFICALDGVGGWIRRLIDSGDMTKELIKIIERGYRPGSSLHEFFDDCIKKVTQGGSTTCVMAELPETSETKGRNVLKTLNLGDSGYMIVRNHEIIFRSESQQHYFDCPYQAGIQYTLPTDAKSESHEVLENDLILMATDGVWDNLFPEDILVCVKSSENLQNVSNCISNLAEVKSYDPKYESPWYLEAKSKNEKNLEKLIGGKQDDITVIISKIEIF